MSSSSTTHASMQNINTDQKQRGLRILSLDDGGIRGLSELLIIREIMLRLMHLENTEIMPKPCEYFDIIGGAGTGGVIALMLGRLRMPIDLAIEKYIWFSQQVYSDGRKRSFQGEKFEATVFKSSMRDIVQSAGFPEDVLMQEDDPVCKSFVVALNSGDRTPWIFKTYKEGSNQDIIFTVVQAARATTAAPEFFEPVFISSGGIHENFVGAGLDYSNPSNLALKEAVKIFGFFQPVACLVNIGAGYSNTVSWKSINVIDQGMLEFIEEMATHSEVLAEEFYMQMPGVFYRFSVDQTVALDDWNKLAETHLYVDAYLQTIQVAQKLDSLIMDLYSHSHKTVFENYKGSQKAEILKKELFSKVSESSYLNTVQAMDNLAETSEKREKIAEVKNLVQEVPKSSKREFNSQQNTMEAMSNLDASTEQAILQMQRAMEHQNAINAANAVDLVLKAGSSK